MTSAAHEHRAILTQMLRLRATAELTDQLEEQILARLDELWEALTDVEREWERALAVEWNRQQAVERSLGLVDTEPPDGAAALPRKAA